MSLSGLYAYGNAPEFDLPKDTNGRWSPRLKQRVVEAVLTGQIALQKIKSEYNLSIDEFLSWQRRYQ